MIILTSMSQSELDAYLEITIREYAQEHVRAGNWSEQEAMQKSRQEFAELLPQGVHSPKQHLYTIRAQATNAPVGMLWYAERNDGQGAYAFIYDIVVDETERGKGYGEAAMRALEGEVRQRGLNQISLHVFGHNTAARRLYEKLGYAPTNIKMSKKLNDA